MKKVIITIMAVITVISLASCHSEPVKPELGSEGEETIITETLIEEDTICEDIIEEDVIEEVYISEEYLAELEFNSQKNEW